MPRIRASIRAAIARLGSLGLTVAVVGPVVTLPVGLEPFAPNAVMAAPEPSPIPTRWELDIDAGPLRVGTVDVPGVGPRAYFYLTYKVTNNSGEDLYFAPSFELATDDGAVLRSGRGVPLAVVDVLQQRLNNPLLLDQISILGTLRQGEENAREGLVVWPADNMMVDEITVYAAGFSGETRRITPPDAAAPSPGQQPEEVVLRKTWMMTHLVPGELTGRGNTPLERTGARWILR